MPGVVTRPAKKPLFRRRVPKDLVSCFPTAEIVKSLGTGSAADIRRRASHARALTEMLFMEVRADPTLTPADVRTLTDVYLADLDRLDRRDRGTLPFALTPAGGDRTAQIRFHEKVAAGAIDRQFEVGGILDPEAVCRIAHEVGIEIDVGSPLEVEINAALSCAYARFHAEKAERLRRDARVGDRGWIDRGLKAVGLRERELPEMADKVHGFEKPDLDPTVPKAYPSAAAPAAPASTSSAEDIAHALSAAIETLADRLANSSPNKVANDDTRPATIAVPVEASASVAVLWKRFVEFKIDKAQEWKRSRRQELQGSIALWQWLGEPSLL